MGSWKTGRELAADGLPRFLRELADALESGAFKPDAPESDSAAPGTAQDQAQGVLAGLPARDFRKLVLVAERRDAGLSLKLKAKRGGEVLVPTVRLAAARGAGKAGPQAGREKYRQLKKALQADFKVLRDAAGEGRMPPPEVLESFLGLAGIMGQGQQPVAGATLAEMARANTAFLNDCQALRQAQAARNAAALAEVLERLARRKSACHAQFG